MSWAHAPIARNKKWRARLAGLAPSIDWVLIALIVIACAAFLRTLSPSVLWADEGEFQYSAYRLFVPHTTGYPLYIFLAKLWTLLPIGDVAYRVNLMSAFWGVVTVGLTYKCIEQLTGRKLPALTAALCLTFGWVFWKQSSIAGVRTMHTAFVALITLLAIGLTQRRASLESLTLAIGLGLTHHRMTLLLLPGLAWVVWQAREQITWSVRRWINCAALLVIPQALYLFVAFGRAWDSPQQFWGFALGTTVEQELLTKPTVYITTQFASQVLPSLWEAFTPVGLALALLGFGGLILDSRREAARQSIGIYLALGWLINIAFAGVHLTEDANKYIAHGFVLEAVALGVGLVMTLEWLERHFNPRLIRRLAWGALALPIALMITNFAAADQSSTGWIGPFTLDDMTVVESNSVLVGDWAFYPAYRYHQVVNTYRPDVQLAFSLDRQAMDGVEKEIYAGRPVYLRERRLGQRWKGKLTFVPVGQVWRVLPTKPVFSAPQRVNARFGDVELTEIAVWPAQLTTDQLMLLQLNWNIPAQLDHKIGVSLRLIDQADITWLQQDKPLRSATGVLSETAWILGPAMPPGDYHWQINVDDQSAGVNLGLADLPPFRHGSF